MSSVHHPPLRFYLATDGLVHISSGWGGIIGSMRCELWARPNGANLVFKVRTPVPGPVTCLQCLALQDDERF